MITLVIDDRELTIREAEVSGDALWRHLGNPIVHSADGSVWLLGEGARIAQRRGLRGK